VKKPKPPKMKRKKARPPQTAIRAKAAFNRRPRLAVSPTLALTAGAAMAASLASRFNED
jgi:hypothetical protein